MEYEILISKRNEGRLVYAKPSPATWGKKECLPLFDKATIDLTSQQLEKLMSSCIYDFKSKKFLYKDDKTDFVAANLLEINYEKKKCEDLVNTDFGEGKKVDDQCYTLSPKHLKDAVDEPITLNNGHIEAEATLKQEKLIKDLRIKFLKLLYPYREVEGIDKLISAVKHGNFSELYYYTKNMNEDVKKEVLSKDNLSDELFHWYKKEWKVI